MKTVAVEMDAEHEIGGGPPQNMTWPLPALS